MPIATFRRTVILACALAAAACRPQEEQDPLDLATAPIDTSVTPDRWRSAHHGDSVGIAGESSWWSAHHENCRSAIGHETYGTMSVRRLALFVVPHPPADYHFDADTSRLAERRCELQSVRLMIAVATEADARHVADSLAHLISARLGASGQTPPPDPDTYPPAQLALEWRHGGTTTLLTVGGVLGGPEHKIVSWRTMVEAYTNVGDAKLNPVSAAEETREGAPPLASQRALLDSLIAAAAIPETRGVVVQLDRLAHDSLPSDPSAVDSVALPAIRALIARSTELPAPRKAAAFLAADLIVGIVAGDFGVRTPPADTETYREAQLKRRDAYEAAGATYGPAPGEGNETPYMYAQNWVESAYHADRFSFAGQHAFMRIFGSAGDLAPGCNRADQYEALIALGEPALRDHIGDSVVLHHTLSEAYADVVTMAMGRDRETIFPLELVERYEGFPTTPGGDVDLGPIRAEARVARRKGFEHARAALALLRQPLDRAAMWDVMFRMVAGIPGPISFFCMGD